MFTDVMVDLETTGTHIDNNAVIQIAAVKFNLETREVSVDSFNKCLSMAPNRYMEENCRTQFWAKIPDVYKAIVERMEPPEQVLRDFNDWALKDTSRDMLRFWGKPITFDYSFLASYYRQYNLPMPFHYRAARDLNSYISGLKGTPETVDVSHMQFEGVEHDGIWDCFHQIRILFDAQDNHVRAEICT